MNRRIFTILIVFVILLSFTSPSSAQMTDAAVTEYVKAGMAAGKSQDEMAKELVARGVTREQVERIKNYLESKGKTAAHVNAVSQDPGVIRENTIDDMGEVGAGLNDNIVPVADAAHAAKIFGHSIFRTNNLTFAPSLNLPTPENYKLGPGDEVVIDIWGASQATIRRTISPEGTINVQELGLVNLNGMTVKEANSYVKRLLGRVYSLDGEEANSEIKLTLGNIRTIQVNVLGEVTLPGTYRLSSFSNIFHAIYRAGGVTDIGTLREIRLVRNGKIITTLDVYDFIFKGSFPANTTLEEGDIVIVPTYDMLVSVDGSVKRPMIYEMKKGETLARLLDYAGGFMGNAYKNSLGIIRQNGKEYKVFTVDRDDYSGFDIMDGDQVKVGEMIDRYENKIEIVGSVYRPGIYQLGNDVSTVRQLIAKADGLTGDAFTNRALLKREKEDLTVEILPLDVKAILDGTSEDIKLRKNDVLFISSIHDLNDRGTISVRGEVAKPGEFAFADNTTLEDIIIQAGGLLESASVVKVDVSRRLKNSSSTEPTSSLSTLYTFSLKNGFVIDGKPNFVLEPYDKVYVRRSPGYKAQTHVNVSGNVLFPGDYALSSRNERISDVIKKAGGVLPWAYLKGARLVRRASAGEIERIQDLKRFVKNDTAMDSLDVNSLNIAYTYSVGVDFSEALNNPGGEDDLIVRDGDAILIPEMVSTVKISGCVLYPNTVSYNSKMSVEDYIRQAGGYGFQAKKNRAFIVYLNGRVAKAKRYSSSVVEPGCEIVVPEKRKRETQLSDILSVATTSASLATMMATIGNLIK